MDGVVAEERHLHPSGMLLAALGSIRRWIGLSAFPGIAALINGEFGMRTLFLVLFAAVVLVVLSAVWGVLSWRATTYRVAGGAFHFKSGVLAKSERSLPLERIGGVNTSQGLVQRLLRVVELRLETAGGGAGESEISLPALSRGTAESLREELTRARQARAGVAEGTEGAEEPATATTPTMLRRLSTRDLVVAGLTSGQIGVAAPVVFGASQTLDNILPFDLFGLLAEALVTEDVPSVYPALVLALAVALAAWALSIAGTVLSHAGFTLSHSPDGKYLHIKRGLLNRYETTVPTARIQAVRVVEGVLRQPFGLAALKVESAGFADEGGVSTTLFPLLPRREVDALLAETAPLFAAPLDDLPGSLPPRARRRYALRAALPALVIAAPLAVFFFPWGLAALLLVLPFAFYGLFCHRTAGYGLHGGRLVLRFRRLARTTVVAPRDRLQSRGYSVSLFQRRPRLATLGVRVASGSGGTAFGIADVDAGAAASLVEALGPGTT